MTTFISYSHKDTDFAHLFANKLKEEGFLVWIDDRIDYGTSWPRKIQEELDECSVFILIMTPSSFESDWVQNELSRAQSKGKKIFPLLLEGDTWLSVQTIQYVNVKGRKLPPPEFYEKLAEVAPGVMYPPASSFPKELQPAGPTDGRQPRKKHVRDLILKAGRSDSFEKKRNIFMKVIQLDPDDPIGFRLLAWTCQKLGDYSSAIEYDRQAINLDPDYAKAYVGLIIAGRQTGDYSLANENWSKLREICGETERPFHEAAYWFADSLESRGNYIDAKQWFRHVTEEWWKPANEYENWLLSQAKSKLQTTSQSNEARDKIIVNNLDKQHSSRLSGAKLLAVTLFVIGIILALVTNVASANLPKEFEPYLWLSWPLLGVLTIVSILVLLKQQGQ